jgi:hypothetical protein
MLHKKMAFAGLLVLLAILAGQSISFGNSRLFV